VAAGRRDRRARGEALSPRRKKTPPPREARVEIVAGSGQGNGIGLALGAKATLGRASESSLKVPDAKVSRAHLEIEHREEGLFVREVGRAGVALLDGRPIPKEGVLIGLRARIALGDSALELARFTPARRPDLEGIELGEPLGSGGVATVYAAWQDPPGRDVAVKVLNDDAAAEDARRLVREAVLEGKLDHPSIARVFDLVETGGTLHLIRELVEGETLAALVSKAKLPPPRVARLGADLASALAHAHAKGVVHRDVKPENVLLDAAGLAKLVDFGFAKDARAELTRLTATGDAFGTISYVAPEQLDGAGAVGPPCDVYGLGALLYFAVSGTAPFSDVPFDRYVERLRGEGPTPLGSRAPGPLAAVIARAMSVPPASRPGAEEVARELAKLAR
jgi:hypothetical protein